MTMPKKTVYLDIETFHWFDSPEIARLPSRELQLLALEFGCAVTYDLDQEEYLEWWTGDADRLVNYLRNYNLVAGWNIASFDLPIVLFYGSGNPNHYPTTHVYDLFDLIRKATNRWYKLDLIAQTNLGQAKTADGKQAAMWLHEWRNGEHRDPSLFQQALDYCRNDVRLEMELGELARRGLPLTLPGLPKPGQGQPLRFALKPDFTYSVEIVPGEGGLYA
jgi:hypothetical protein